MRHNLKNSIFISIILLLYCFTVLIDQSFKFKCRIYIGISRTVSCISQSQETCLEKSEGAVLYTIIVRTKQYFTKEYIIITITTYLHNLYTDTSIEPLRTILHTHKQDHVQLLISSQFLPFPNLHTNYQPDVKLSFINVKVNMSTTEHLF